MSDLTRRDVYWSAAFAAALGVAVALAMVAACLFLAGDKKGGVDAMLSAFVAGCLSTGMQVLWERERFTQRSLVGFSLAAVFVLMGLGAYFLAYAGWSAALFTWACAGLVAWATALVYRIAIAG